MIILFIAPSNLSGQFYITGQSPASLKWRQLNTGNFKLIYPETFEGRGLELGGILEDAWQLTGYSLDHQPALVPVIVHNHNSRANGLVVWAPKRMELYTTAPQSGMGGHWLTRLTVHEQRHVVQIDKLDQGITGIFSWILGEQAIGATAGRLPLWFLEGDAVVSETVLTLSGRGRASSFNMPLRALLSGGKELYGYDKFLHGSFKDYVPDHYKYGYQIVSSLREEYGASVWENALNFVARRPYYISPFTRSLKKDTGKSIDMLHQEVFARIAGEWGTLYDRHTTGSHKIINRREERLYHSYRYPVWSGDTAIIALKTGIAQVDEIVIMDLNGEEDNLFYPGPLSSPTLTVSGSRIAWSEFRPDVRWGLSQYSVIRVIDIKSGELRTVSSKSRYFSPVFEPRGLFMAVVEVDPANRSFIVLLNSVTGEVAAKFPSFEGKDLIQPNFSPDGSEILVTAVCKEGNSILSLDVNTGEWNEITSPSHVNISGVFPCGQLVCFNADMQGIDNIFATDRQDGSLYQLTSSAFGAFNGGLSPRGNMLAWSDYSEEGFDLAVSQFDPGKLNVFDGDSFTREELLKTLVSQEKGIIVNKDQDTLALNSKPYRKGLNLFRFHSWAPFYFDYSQLSIEQLSVYPGLSLISQNLLNTANTFLGYSYKNGRHVAHGDFVYKGLYPVIEAGFDYGDEPVAFMGRDSIGPQHTPGNNHLNMRGAVYIPLDLSSGRFIAGAEPRLHVSYNNSLYHYDRENEYKRGMTTISSRFRAYRYARMSLRDLAPRWGQVFRWQRRSAPFESENLGVINAAELTLYFPGLFSHHSLKLDAAIQRQDPVKYYYSGLVDFPRGYPQEASEQLQVLKSGYSFPFLYPDLAVDGILYLKRLHGDLFADFGSNRIHVADNEAGGLKLNEERLFSWGGGITANFHVLRMLFPINMRAGVAHLPYRNEFIPLFSLGIDY